MESLTSAVGDPMGVTRATTPVIITDSLNANRTDDNVSFRGGVNWKPSRDQLFYASVSRGFRQRRLQPPRRGGDHHLQAGEQLTAFEVGSKSRISQSHGRT